MNSRKLTTELSHHDIAALEHANYQARLLGLPLNTLITFAPWRDRPWGFNPGVEEVGRSFKRLRSHLDMWVRRHVKAPFTAIMVRHADEDGGRPHLHAFLHLPSRHYDDIRAALTKTYPDPGVIDVERGNDTRVKHSSGYWGSTFDYITRFKSQQAFFSQRGAAWRASRIDENGRHRGIKTPYVGRRWTCTRNIQPTVEQHTKPHSRPWSSPRPHVPALAAAA